MLIFDVLNALSKSDKVIIAITQKPVQDSELAESLRMKTAIVVQMVLNATEIRELFIEGGATAEAVLRAIDCFRLDVLGEYTPGVVQMQVSGKKEQYVTIKPGSYPWPKGIWI